MWTVFWGRQDILIVEFLFRVETINALRYSKTLGPRYKTKGAECSMRALCCFMTAHDSILLVSLRTSLKNLVRSSLITHCTAQISHLLFTPHIWTLKCDFGGRREKRCSSVVVSTSGIFLWRGCGKIDITLRQMSEQCWKLCEEIVYDMLLNVKVNLIENRNFFIFLRCTIFGIT